MQWHHLFQWFTKEPLVEIYWHYKCWAIYIDYLIWSFHQPCEGGFYSHYASENIEAYNGKPGPQIQSCLALKLRIFSRTATILTISIFVQWVHFFLFFVVFIQMQCTCWAVETQAQGNRGATENRYGEFCGFCRQVLRGWWQRGLLCFGGTGVVCLHFNMSNFLCCCIWSS